MKCIISNILCEQNILLFHLHMQTFPDPGQESSKNNLEKGTAMQGAIWAGKNDILHEQNRWMHIELESN